MFTDRFYRASGSHASAFPTSSAFTPSSTSGGKSTFTSTYPSGFEPLSSFGSDWRPSGSSWSKPATFYDSGRRSSPSPPPARSPSPPPPRTRSPSPPSRPSYASPAYGSSPDFTRSISISIPITIHGDSFRRGSPAPSSYQSSRSATPEPLESLFASCKVTDEYPTERVDPSAQQREYRSRTNSWSSSEDTTLGDDDNAYSDVGDDYERVYETAAEQALLYNGSPYNIDQRRLSIMYAPLGSSYLIRRCALSDGSCLFHAMAFVTKNRLGKAPVLRRRVAAYMRRHPSIYYAAGFTMTVHEYSRWILHPRNWGGALELDIMAILFGLQIYSIDIRDLHIDKYGRHQYPTRVFLVYTGSHYDAVGLAPTLNMKFEDDVTEFDADVPQYTSALKRLGRVIQEDNTANL
ncbi:hypothetical protein IWQ60_008196 [Tieghemiomyces parasiticus]|uniref:Ubiquitin thioesterase OTU n=1 Tax=Tieghemiomyces parasiticus TaxID=78921 RepID=A0A9W7ZZU5_9FUNG|nr:hypothetical protein IWQ60_008196 [Tieghemiomyces parasiticus]